MRSGLDPVQSDPNSVTTKTRGVWDPNNDYSEQILAGTPSFVSGTSSLTRSCRAIAWNGTVFCAVANNNFTPFDFNDHAYTSTDGITWTQRTLASTGTWSAIAWNGTVFCAVAVAPEYANTSTDGITWVARTAFLAPAIAWNGTVFCAVASGTNAYTSNPNATEFVFETQSNLT